MYKTKTNRRNIPVIIQFRMKKIIHLSFPGKITGKHPSDNCSQRVLILYLGKMQHAAFSAKSKKPSTSPFSS